MILGSVRDVKIFHLLALGSSLLAQGLWNGHGSGSMGRTAVGRLPLSCLACQDDLVLDL